VVLAAPLSALSHRHPHLRIHILAAHKTAGLEKREADIAIRLHRPEKGDLTAQKIDEMAFHFYATEAYLRMTPPDKHILIGNDGRLKDTPQEHILTTLQNETTQPHITPACGAYPHLTSNALEIQMALVRANAGIALLPDFMAAQDCNLIKLPSPSPLTRDVWLVIHSDFKNSPPIRAVIDALTQEIAPNHTP
jgi:DNA-binding transcriptional LysR family regulator